MAANPLHECEHPWCALNTAKRPDGYARPGNVPADMVCTPPVGSPYKVGDPVTVTNDQGVTFDKAVRGFPARPHAAGVDGVRPRDVYVWTDAWWMPSRHDQLMPRGDTHSGA